MDPASHGIPANAPWNTAYVDELAEILLDHPGLGFRSCPENGGMPSILQE
jgi:hypothetical protein